MIVTQIITPLLYEIRECENVLILFLTISDCVNTENFVSMTLDVHCTWISLCCILRNIEMEFAIYISIYFQSAVQFEHPYKK